MNKSVSMILSLSMKYRFQLEYSPPKTRYEPRGGGRGALGYFLGGYVPPGLQIGTPF